MKQAIKTKCLNKTLLRFAEDLSDEEQKERAGRRVKTPPNLELNKMIENIQQAKEYINECEGGNLNEINYKWEIIFRTGDNPFYFKDDEDLINWCNEQKNNYFQDWKPKK